MHPEYRGAGLGKLAVEYCLELFKKISGIEKVIVDAFQIAFPLFARFGFTTVECKKDYWGSGLDLVKMALRLH